MLIDHDASTARGIEVVVAFSKSATRSHQRRSRSSVRDRTILRIKEVGRRQCQSPVEEGVGIPSSSPSGKHILSVQNDLWPKTSRSESRVTTSGGDHRLQHPRPDDRSRKARIFRDWCLRNPWMWRCCCRVPIYAPTPPVIRKYLTYRARETLQLPCSPWRVRRRGQSGRSRRAGRCSGRCGS